MKNVALRNKHRLTFPKQTDDDGNTIDEKPKHYVSFRVWLRGLPGDTEMSEKAEKIRRRK